MVAELEQIVAEREKENNLTRRQLLSKGWNAAKIMAGAGLAGIVAGLSSEAGADSVKVIKDKDGNVISREHVYELGTHGPTYAPPEQKSTPGYSSRRQEYNDRMWEGIRAYQNGNFSYAHDKFGEIYRNFPGEVAPRVWKIKSIYMETLNRDGKTMALINTKHALNMNLKDMPTNPSLKAFRERLEKDYHPESFTAESHEIYLRAREAFGREDYAKAIELVKDSIENPVYGDPYVFDKWFIFGRATFWNASGNYKNKYKNELIIYQKAKKFIPEDKNINNEISWITDYINKES